MPLIRVARDKRGLDTLYLLHPKPDMRGETRLRVIYFCTAPQGLTFGRRCLDAERQRALERQYPEIRFDWAALLQELEQRRLPPPPESVVRRHAARAPGPKTERRPSSSDIPAAVSRGRKRERTGAGVVTVPPPLATGGGLPEPTRPSVTSAPIIK